MMTTFSEWKSLPTVRTMVPALVDIDLDKLDSWSDYRTAVYLADRSEILTRVRAWPQNHTGTEATAFAAVLSTMDYTSLSAEVLEQAGVTNFFGPINRMDEVHRATVVGALAWRD
jgi:hypothetical protein